MILKEENKTHVIYEVLGIKFKIRKISNNKIYVIDESGREKRVFSIRGLNVCFRGKNSVITIHKPMIKFKDSKIICGSNCNIEIKSSNENANKLSILANADNSEIKIGKNFYCTNECIILSRKDPNLSIEIGNNCMFGSNIIIRNTDSHTIIDKTTKEVLNRGKDVEIGNHVWLARDVVVMKGVKIPDNCVVGACSVVTKPLTEENAIYAGVPAKKIKSNIEWFRSSIPKYEEAIEKGEVPV